LDAQGIEKRGKRSLTSEESGLNVADLLDMNEKKTPLLLYRRRILRYTAGEWGQLNKPSVCSLPSWKFRIKTGVHDLEKRGVMTMIGTQTFTEREKGPKQTWVVHCFQKKFFNRQNVFRRSRCEKKRLP